MLSPAELSPAWSVDELAKTALLVAIRAAGGDMAARCLLERTPDSPRLLVGCQGDTDAPRAIIVAVAGLASLLADDVQLRDVAEELQSELDGRDWELLAREVALDCGMLEFG